MVYAPKPDFLQVSCHRLYEVVLDYFLLEIINYIPDHFPPTPHGMVSVEEAQPARLMSYQLAVPTGLHSFCKKAARKFITSGLYKKNTKRSYLRIFRTSVTIFSIIAPMTKPPRALATTFAAHANAGTSARACSMASRP